jgi:hypothetical protein
MSADSIVQPKNRILAALPSDEYKRLLPHLKPVTLEYKQVLFESHKTIRYAYGIFQKKGIISYSRGRMEILDRHKLEETACECY